MSKLGQVSGENIGSAGTLLLDSSNNSIMCACPTINGIISEGDARSSKVDYDDSNGNAFSFKLIYSHRPLHKIRNSYNHVQLTKERREEKNKFPCTQKD